MSCIKKSLFLGLVVCHAVMAQTQMELNESACGKAKGADQELNKVYQQVLQQHKGDAVFIRHFKKAERKWMEFRDAYVASMYIPENKHSYGSILPVCECNLIEDITQIRIKQIQRWVKGPIEGDACNGSLIKK